MNRSRSSGGQLNETSDLEALLAGDVFAALSDQSFESLTDCYRGGTLPASQTVGGVFAERSLGWRVAAFGAAARNRIHLVELRDALLAQTAIGPDELPTPQLRTEYIWFLFSQRAWSLIIRFVEAMDISERGDLQPHIADIYFLSFYRLQVDRIMTGEDRDGFLADAGRALSLLRLSWPDAVEHLAAYEAMVDHIGGDVDGARQKFVAVAAADFVSPLSAVRTVLNGPAPHGRHTPELVIRPAPRRAATVISLDRVYFDRFVRLFAERYGQNNAENGLHIHCVGFDPSDEVKSWGFPVAIGLTIDQRDVSSLPPLDRAGYYASARYLYLPEYLRRYETVYVADADGLVLRDIATIEADLGDADVALGSRVLEPQRRLFRLPWEAISAGSLFVRSTSGGKLFAQAVSAYLEEAVRRTFQQAAPLWFADQNALFYSWDELRDGVRFERFRKAGFAQESAWTLFESLDAKVDFLRRSGMPRT